MGKCNSENSDAYVSKLELQEIVTRIAQANY